VVEGTTWNANGVENDEDLLVDLAEKNLVRLTET